MTERFKVWRCIGCGRIDGPQPCIGICEDRSAELVDASDFDRLVAREAQARRRIGMLEELVRRLAATTPREGEWENSYTAFQDRARRLLETAGRGGTGET